MLHNFSSVLAQTGSSCVAVNCDVIAVDGFNCLNCLTGKYSAFWRCIILYGIWEINFLSNECMHIQ